VLPPSDIAKWHFLEERARAVLDAFGYREVRTPLVDADGKLRPPGVGPLLRAHQSLGAGDTRWYQLGPTFGPGERADLTGAVFAPPSPASDAEAMAMLCGLLVEAGVGEPRLVVAGAAEVGAVLERLHIEHRLEEGARTTFTISAGHVTLARGGRSEGILGFTVELAPVVAAIPDEAQSYVLPPAAVFVAEGEEARLQALVTAHRLRLAGIRIELDQAPAARLRVTVGEKTALVEDLETGRTDTVADEDLETTIRARMD
jgi:hypothetical protein